MKISLGNIKGIWRIIKSRIRRKFRRYKIANVDFNYEQTEEEKSFFE